MGTLFQNFELIIDCFPFTRQDGFVQEINELGRHFVQLVGKTL